MLNIQRFVCNMLQENCYVVSDETAEAVIIDCGAFFKEERRAITDYIAEKHLKPVHLLCTHGHFDHCCGNDTIYATFGLKPEVCEPDAWLMESMADQAMQILGININATTPPVGHFLSADEKISFGSHELRVLPTPGHTPGSALFYCAAEKTVFTGDTLFMQSIGRTDFERGSFKDMMLSLKNVVGQLPPETAALCGHGPNTTIAQELFANPYLRM